MHSDSQSGKDEPAPIVALTGFMAAGKSTVGRALADLLGWRFVDLDCEIESCAGLRIHEIFARHGEAHFRQLEAEALRRSLRDSSVATVIALGGGTFIDPRNAESLRRQGARIVFLEMPVGKLLQRCRAAGEATRPLASDAAAFCALYAQRLPQYRQAELVINTEGKAAGEVAREIARRLDASRKASR